MITADLKGKVAIVTGAGRGIGKAIALLLSECGCNLLLAARTESKLIEVAEESKTHGIDAIPLKVDVSKEEDVKRMVEETIKKFGKVDVLVSNAGVGYAVPIVKTEEKDWDKMMDINAKGTFLCCREVFKEMIRLKISGAIINIASYAGKRGYLHQSAYYASKFAIVGFSKVLAMEGKEFGIRVHVICPGGVNTDFIKQMRPDIKPSTLIQPRDIADIVIFLITRREDVVIDEVLIRRFASQIL